MLTAAGWAMSGTAPVLPALALFRPGPISRLHGVEAGSTACLLLHHRAALFLAIWVAYVRAMRRPEARAPATAALGVSMPSFLLLQGLGGSPAALRAVALADPMGLPFLALDGWRAVRPA